MVIGVIGGSGLYQFSPSGEALDIDTPFGKPSGKIYRERFKSNTVLFLARHGEGHALLPSEINFRANLFALKQLGATAVISVSAVGSMKREIRPGDFVLPSQFIDMTRGVRPNTFFGNGIVAHAHFADPICSTLSAHLCGAAKESQIPVHGGGTYLCIEGPQFSTRAESHFYRSLDLQGGGIHVIGMTALPEARLAREARLCYVTLAMATDYDCWNREHGDLSVESILNILRNNVEHSQKLLRSVLSEDVPKCQSGCWDAMSHAVITPQERWPSSRREALQVILA